MSSENPLYQQKETISIVRISSPSPLKGLDKTPSMSSNVFTTIASP
jgi:hypothetical protein